MTVANLRLAMTAMASRDTRVGDICDELGISRQTLYRLVDASGKLRPDWRKLLNRGRSASGSG